VLVALVLMFPALGLMFGVLLVVVSPSLGLVLIIGGYAYLFFVVWQSRWARWGFVVVLFGSLIAVYIPRLKTELALFRLGRGILHDSSFDAASVRGLMLPVGHCGSYCYDMLLGGQFDFVELRKASASAELTKIVRWRLLKGKPVCSQAKRARKTLTVPKRYMKISRDDFCIIREDIDAQLSEYSVSIETRYACLPKSKGIRYHVLNAAQKPVYSLVFCETKVMTFPTLLAFSPEYGDLEVLERTRSSGPRSLAEFLSTAFDENYGNELED